MAEIKWVKIVTDIFDNRKIRQIESLPEGDTIIVIWFKLLCLAGTINDNGNIYITEEIPYTDETLSTQFNRPLKIIQLALQTFQSFGMIEIIDDILKVSNWESYQNVAGMEKIRENTRKRVADYRARKRLGVVSTGNQCVYCGRNANTVDHIIPISKGGKNEYDNLVPCCKSCNSSKKDKDLVDFLNDSFTLTHQNIDHELVRTNEKLMKYVSWDNNTGCYVTVTQSNAIDKNKNKNRIDKNRISNIFIVYEEEIGSLTPFQVEKLESYLDDLSEEMIIEAIKRASSYNKRSLSYIEGILKNWIRNGYKVLADIQDEKPKGKFNTVESTHGDLSELYEN